MGQPVPADDLPSNLVPASDLPNSSPPSESAPVTVTPPLGAMGGALEGGKQALRSMFLESPATAMAPGVASGSRALGEVADRAAYKAGGAVTDLSAKVMPPQAAAGLGYATNVGIQAVPAVLGAKGGSKLAPVMEREARGLMSSALKPDKFARESGNAERAITTLLDKGYNVTAGGVEKMTAAIDKLDDQLDVALKNAQGSIQTRAIVQPVKDAIAKFKDGLDHAENTEAIRKEVLKFFDHPEVQRALQIPVGTAQRIKRAIYKELGDKAYGLGIKPEAQAEGKKAIARGLKEGIEQAVPGTEGINREMGDLINARDIAQQRVGTAANRDILGLGAFAIRHPIEFLTWMANRNEMAKSVAARALHATPGAVPTAAGGLAGGAAGAVEGRGGQ